MTKQIVFIINSIAHRFKSVDFAALIDRYLDKALYHYQIVYTQHANHAHDIAKVALENGVDIITAVGGDGTINQIGKALVNTPGTLGIIPFGSGNGLARHLGIPLDIPAAISLLNADTFVVIDSAIINGYPFFGVSGIGFDALVALKFASFGRRGLSSYIRIICREYFNYQAESYHLIVDGREVDCKPFMICFANSSQYGHGVRVAPNAKLNDGKLDLLIVTDAPWQAMPGLLYRSLCGGLEKSKHVMLTQFSEVIVKKPRLQMHMDGEPIVFTDEITVRVVPASLKVMCHPTL